MSVQIPQIVIDQYPNEERAKKACEEDIVVSNLHRGKLSKIQAMEILNISEEKLIELLKRHNMLDHISL